MAARAQPEKGSFARDPLDWLALYQARELSAKRGRRVLSGERGFPALLKVTLHSRRFNHLTFEKDKYIPLFKAIF